MEWKDQVFVLIMSFVLSSDEQVIRLRKRPKETSFKTKTIRISFGKETIKEFSIPVITNEYNYQMGTINAFDYLIA